MKIGEIMYAANQQQPEAAADNAGADKADDGKVVDADFEEIKDENKG